MTRRVLIVDDDRDIREVLQEMLVGEGYDVRTAANGREALELLGGDWHPRVILLDLMMPVMDGWEFRSQQLARPGLAAIPVVVVSADRNAEQACAELRAASCFRKPLELERLLAELSRLSGS